MKSRAFHLAFPVHCLEEAKSFYLDKLACSQGRETEEWVDFDFFGHQLTAHLAPHSEHSYNEVDHHQIPVPHFGCVLEWDDFHQLKAQLEGLKVPFEVGPYIRFEGQVGEQATMFIKDPSGNFLEFKSFKNYEQLFASDG